MHQRWPTILTILALLLCPALWAQEDKDVRGTLLSQDDTSLTVRTLDGRELTFAISEQSQLPATLSVGDTVIVHHQITPGESGLQQVNEARLADRVDIDPAGGPEATLPATASPLGSVLLIGLAALGVAAVLSRRP